MTDSITERRLFRAWLESKGYSKNLDAKIKRNNELICTIKGSEKYQVENINKNTEGVAESLISSGFAHLKLNFTPSTRTTSLDSATLDAEIDDWLKKILKTDYKFVLDTNVIIDRLFSNIDLISGRHVTKNLALQIPRLSILELERKANDENKTLAKRMTLSGYGEILYLKNQGAVPLGELNIETLTGFSNISSKHRTDSWIRREINEAKRIPKSKSTSDLRKEVLLGRIDSPRRFDNYIFITSDLVNSLSAMAENIDTIYVSRDEDWINILRQGNLDQVSRLILTLAVLLESIDVEINGEVLKLNGMWSGKTVFDWSVERVRVIK